MGRPFNLKYDDVVWEENPEGLQACVFIFLSPLDRDLTYWTFSWKDGRTGFPIVDAVSLQNHVLRCNGVLMLMLQAMRALKKQGYMHNRCRMIVAMVRSRWSPVR